MGRSYLSIEKLQQVFPTIGELIRLVKNINHEFWGLCQNDAGDLKFGKGNNEWLLQVTLQAIIEESAVECGEECPTDNVIFFYGADYSGAHNIHFDFFDISSYEEEKIKSPPPITFSY